MNSITKLKKKWHAQLKQWFWDQGITACESCGTTYALTIMHALKQRYCIDEQSYRRAALICQPEHHFWEYGDRDNPGTHERMADFVDSIIEKRNGTSK